MDGALEDEGEEEILGLKSVENEEIKKEEELPSLKKLKWKEKSGESQE